MKVPISWDMTPCILINILGTCVPEEPATSVIRVDAEVLLATDVRNSKKKCIFLNTSEVKRFRTHLIIT